MFNWMETELYIISGSFTNRHEPGLDGIYTEFSGYFNRTPDGRIKGELVDAAGRSSIEGTLDIR
ncbi:MAG: hypothetical protein HYW23_01245 [Candidatus Aenigmarchaeota archaeon]|nr:hypothetical protein [Candidatus Aenigmarchaeota archaeon]